MQVLFQNDHWVQLPIPGEKIDLSKNVFNQNFPWQYWQGMNMVFFYLVKIM